MRTVVLTFAHAQQALRIAQAIAERRPALTLWVSCRSTTAADAFRAMPRARRQQSFAAAIGLAERVMSTLGMSTELIEGHISAMRRRLTQQPFSRSSSSPKSKRLNPFQVLRDQLAIEFYERFGRSSRSCCRR
jgi:CPA2 family monovalent cation:H+ antiporter-2